MLRLWNILAPFNVLFLFNQWWLDRTDRPPISIFTPDSRMESVPIFGLTIGSLITLLSFVFFLAEVKKRWRQGRVWYDRVPPLWLNDIEFAAKTRRRWKSSIIALCLVFPLAAQIHFWNRFDEWQAWKNHGADSGQEVALLEPVSIAFLLDFDAHRYGNYTRRNEEDRQGVSFVPFWQPVIMGILSLSIIVYAILISIALARRNPRV